MEQIKQYEYVDLGLPSGLKWATMNVGATSETDYGSYFQWGDIVDKNNADCSWESYKYCKGTYNTLTKYCVDNDEYGPFGTVDNKITLDLEDDAARAHMGGEWRMPTKAEIQELLDNTDYEWIEDYNGSGVKGRKFTSKTNGNSIFFPASGFRSGSTFFSQGGYSSIWSSSLNTVNLDYARCLDFGLICISAVHSSLRCYSFVVRGVKN